MCIFTGCSHYMPGRLPRLNRGRADTRMMVCFLQPGCFSPLGIALQGLPRLLCSWTHMAHLGGPRQCVTSGWSACMLSCSRGHRAGEVPAPSGLGVRPQPAASWLCASGQLTQALQVSVWSVIPQRVSGSQWEHVGSQTGCSPCPECSSPRSRQARCLTSFKALAGLRLRGQRT